jgi:hypothetical protein
MVRSHPGSPNFPINSSTSHFTSSGRMERTVTADPQRTSPTTKPHSPPHAFAADGGTLTERLIQRPATRPLSGCRRADARRRVGTRRLHPVNNLCSPPTKKIRERPLTWSSSSTKSRRWRVLRRLPPHGRGHELPSVPERTFPFQGCQMQKWHTPPRLRLQR